MATLLLKDINKIYPNKVQAVFDFNLEIQDKEFVVFVGPSGCGKSTTLRMIAGLEDISSGELYIDGQLMNAVEPKDRNIAMVFQNYALYPHMTVYANMKFALKLRKVLMPIYQNETDVASIVENEKAISLDIKKLNKEFKKADESTEILAKRSLLYRKLFDLEKEKEAILKPVIGIDELQIKEINKQINSLKKEIIQNNKNIEKYKEKADVTPLEMANQQREGLIKQLEERIEYLKNNEVPLTKFRKLTNFEMDLEINRVAESIDLARYLFRKPSALSGGQRQRVALGRAIVRKPKVFLMDEPLSNLDAKLRVQTRAEITRIHQQVGATTIYVTHDQTEAMTMADRIVVMKDGYIQQVGAPDQLYDNPQNMFVGGFIGSPAMNFIKGVIDKDTFITKPIDKENNEEGLPYGADEFNVKLDKKDVALLKEYDGQEVYLGIRPEAIYLASDNSNPNPSKTYKLECQYSELLGYELILYAYVLGQRIIGKVDCEKRFKPHEIVELTLNNNKLYFFDKDGKRIQ